MTSKKRRQRGSRTHGGGSHKKRRGAGHRGGRDEDAIVLAERGLATEDGDGYAMDVRDIVEDGHEADVVKVLGAGQVHGALTVTADAFSDDAEAALEAAGGEAVLSERGEERAAEAEEAAEETTTEEDNE
jgi:large subunit ribosomal protein L15